MCCPCASVPWIWVKRWAYDDVRWLPCDPKPALSTATRSVGGECQPLRFGDGKTTDAEEDCWAAIWKDRNATFPSSTNGFGTRRWVTAIYQQGGRIVGHGRDCAPCFWWEALLRMRLRGGKEYCDRLRRLTAMVVARSEDGCEEDLRIRGPIPFANAGKVDLGNDPPARWGELQCVVGVKRTPRRGGERKMQWAKWVARQS